MGWKDTWLVKESDDKVAPGSSRSLQLTQYSRLRLQGEMEEQQILNWLQIKHGDLLPRAWEKDVEEGDKGADRWFNYHQKTVTRLRELVSILENPEIEDGAQIKLRGNDFSQLRRVAEKKAAESISNNDPNNEEASILEDLTKMLGDGIG